MPEHRWELELHREREFNDWMKKFKIDKIILTKKELKWVRKGFYELYESLRKANLSKR